MHVVPAGQIHLDHCYRCGGSFFDFGEAFHVHGEKVDPRAWRPEAFARPAQIGRLMCPAGHGPMWSYLLAHDDKQVEVDACGACYGLWLDAREAELVTEIGTAVEREQARPGARAGKLGIAAMYLVQLLTFIPVEAHHPVRRKPVLIYSLVAVLTLIYALEVATAVTGHQDAFVNALALVPISFEKGAIYQAVTYAFLHGGIAHLVGNLYFLWIFGDNVEDLLGRKRFTLLYLLTAVVAGLSHWLGNLHSAGPMVGASGAIAGLMGAYMVLFPRVKVWIVFFFFPFKLRAIWYLLIWIGLQFLVLFEKDSNVAWLAHVGGFVSGALLGLAFKPAAPGPTAPRLAA